MMQKCELSQVTFGLCVKGKGVKESGIFVTVGSCFTFEIYQSIPDAFGFGENLAQHIEGGGGFHALFGYPDRVPIPRAEISGS